MPSPVPSTYPVANMTIDYADYPPEWKPLANDAADSSFRGSPMSPFYKGGRVGTKPIAIRVPKSPEHHAKGGLAGEAQKVANAGVGGDELIIHINRDEFDQLKKHWGEPTINPHTGMPQFTPFYKQSWFAPVAAIGSAALMATGIGAPLGAALLPEALAGSTIAGAALPSVVGNALIGTGVGALTGGSKGALTGALLGGIGTVGAGALGSTAAGVTSTGQEGMSGWWNRMGSGNYFTTGLVNPETPKLYPLNALDSNPASVGPYGPQVPPGAEKAFEAATKVGEGGSYIAPTGVAGTAGAAAGKGILGSLGGSSMLLPAALLGAAVLGNKPAAALPQSDTKGPTDPNMTKPLDTTPLYRPRLALNLDYYNYGAGPEATYYGPAAARPADTPAPTVAAATGGPLSRFVEGGGTGRSDSIDAKLSDGEYVIDAETVALLGDGSSKAGAKRLDQFRANIRKQKGRELAKGKFSSDARSPEEYI